MWFSRLVDSWRRTTPDAVSERVREVEERVESLTPIDAENRAKEIIASGSLFKVDLGAPTLEELRAISLLPIKVQEFFQRYRSVETNSMSLSRSAIANYQRGVGLIRVGSDLEHASVLVRLTDGMTFVVEEDGRPQLDLSDSHATIWHYLLFVYETSQPI